MKINEQKFYIETGVYIFQKYELMVGCGKKYYGF